MKKRSIIAVTAALSVLCAALVFALVPNRTGFGGQDSEEAAAAKQCVINGHHYLSQTSIVPVAYLRRNLDAEGNLIALLTPEQNELLLKRQTEPLFSFFVPGYAEAMANAAESNLAAMAESGGIDGNGCFSVGVAAGLADPKVTECAIHGDTAEVTLNATDWLLCIDQDRPDGGYIVRLIPSRNTLRYRLKRMKERWYIAENPEMICPGAPTRYGIGQREFATLSAAMAAAEKEEIEKNIPGAAYFHLFP